MSLKSLNNINGNGEIMSQELDQLIESGIDIIYQTFKSNIGNYIDQVKKQKKTINDLTKKIDLMKEEIGMIQRENQYYKVQNEQLKNEIEKLNKVVNSIKGKLTKFDFKINSKGMIENINYKNLNINNDSKLLFSNRQREYIPFNIQFKKDNYTFNDVQNNNNDSKNNNIMSRDRSFKKWEKNSKTIRYDIKRFHIDDTNESDINNADNNIDIEQELNIDNFKKNFNLDNNLNKMNEKKNINIIKNQKQRYTHLKNKKIDPNLLNDILDNHAHLKNNTINIKLKDNNRNRINNEKKIIKKQANNSLDNQQEKALGNKYSSINFNSNKSEKELFIHKKINEINKIRSNSSNDVIIKRDNYKTEIKNLTNRNNGREEIFQMLNEIPLPQVFGPNNI
jgi:regulator of replication initiation timing